MKHRVHRLVAAMLMAFAFAATASAKTIDIRPGADADQRLQQAFAEAQNGDVIIIRQGLYTLSAGLRLSAERVAVRGEGADRTILNFSGQSRPAPGLTVLADGATLRDFTIDDARGDGVRALGADGLEVQNVTVRWNNPPAAEADGIAVADAGNVQLAGVVASGAPGAGLRLSGVRTAIVREVAATGNGVGLAIHDSAAVDVHSSRFAANAVGVTVRDRPGAAVGGSRAIHIFRNRIEANAAAPPAALGPEGGLAPATGVGVSVFAARGVFISENVIAEHPTVGVLIMAEPETSADARFNALPRDVAVLANSFGRSGFAPAGGLAVFDGADIVWDGAQIFVVGGQVRSEPVRLSIQGNIGLAGPARFSNLNLSTAGSDPVDAAPDPTLPDPINFPAPARVEVRR